MLNLFKRTIIFAIIYFITSAVLFPALFMVWPGFPFFPKIVAQSNNEIIPSVHLPKGSYYIQFFIDGVQALQTWHGDVGKIEVQEIKPEGKREPVSVQPSDFYFDDAPNRSGIRGHSVGCIQLQHDADISLKCDFKRHGYQGVIIKSGFGPMLFAFLGSEIGAIFISIGIFALFLSRSRRKTV